MSVGIETGESNTGKLQHTKVEAGKGRELRMHTPPLLKLWILQSNSFNSLGWAPAV